MPTCSGANYSNTDKGEKGQEAIALKTSTKKVNACSECTILRMKLHQVELDLEKERSLRHKFESEVQVVMKELSVEKEWRKSTEADLKALISRFNPMLMNPQALQHEETIEALPQALQHEETIEALPESVAVKHAIAVNAVHDELKRWKESDKFKTKPCFKEFRPCEIEKAIETKVEIGGRGFGKVYRAELDSKAVAIKILNTFSLQGAREFHTEVEVLSKVEHPNVMKLIGFSKEKNALVYEYLENGSLSDLLQSDKCLLSWKRRLEVSLQLCSALVYLHNMTKPIVHGDLKPENILFDSNCTPKLGDFGISYQLERVSETGTWHHATSGTPRGSPNYLDPEFSETCKLTAAADVYAFGVILLQLVTNQDAANLVKLVTQKLSQSKVIEKKKVDVQKMLLKKMGLVDSRLNQAEWNPADVLLLLRLGIQCAHPIRKDRPSLSGYVWHELLKIVQELDKASYNLQS